MITGSKLRSSRGNRGFTLVEQVMAALIMILVFSSIMLAMSGGFNLTRGSQESLRATQLLTEKMELMRLYTWQQITNGTSIPTNFTDSYYAYSTNASSQTAMYTGTVAIVTVPFTNNYKSALKMITVSVNWVSGGNLHTRSMQTLVSSNGLQAYVY